MITSGPIAKPLLATDLESKYVLKINEAVKGKEHIKVKFAVLEHSGELTLPAPEWFQEHTYTVKVEKDKKLSGVRRTVWDYVNACTVQIVGKWLENQNYKHFKLELAQ